MASENFPTPNAPEMPALLDEQTGLYNRKWLEQNLDRLSETMPGDFSFMFLDLDDFKQTNDTLGHHIGDEMLKDASVSIGKSLRHESSEPANERRTDAERQQTDSFGLTKDGRATRMQGDEFGIILVGVTDDKELQIIKARIQSNLAQKNLKASIGYAAHQVGESRKKIMARADVAMQANKLERKELAWRQELATAPRRKRLAHHLSAKLLSYSEIKPPVSR